MGHCACRIIGVERQCVAIAAMFVHGDGLHTSTTRLRCMAFGALDNARAVRCNDAVRIHMYFVIEAEIGKVGVSDPASGR